MPRDTDKAKGERQLFAKLLADVLPKNPKKAPARVLAEAIGVGERDARYYLDAERAPGLGVLARIEQAFGITPGRILGLAESANPAADSLPTQPPEAIMAIYVDAIVGAVRDILENDHELELTPRGRAFLGEVFLELGAKLHARGHLDASRLFDVALTLKEGERKKKRGT